MKTDTPSVTGNADAMKAERWDAILYGSAGGVAATVEVRDFFSSNSKALAYVRSRPCVAADGDAADERA
jgi:hypothetical protein